MKIPLSWLREYVDINLPSAELAHNLTMAGNEVGEINDIGGTWGNVYVGHVISIEPHPNADRLRLVTVSLGHEEITVVCGAPNVAQGQRIAFAQVGANLVDSHTGETETLQAATIRGVVSSGMVCSERELGIGDHHAGILVLPEDAPIGKPLVEYMGDVIFDIEVTPNRSDCLSVIGVAREVAALTGKTVREPDNFYAEEGDPIKDMINVEIADSELCQRYTASVIQGVKVGPSPLWMQNRQLKVGQRPINNVVDVTNYVMLEYGQPLHAFDYITLIGGKIIIRPAHDQEVFVTLDDAERKLNPPMLVIADAERSVALAGIMGGLNTEITEDTTTVLLESATFDAINTRRTSQALRLRSESSSRFDKGIQPELSAIALKRATKLILQLAGGRVCKGMMDAYPQPKETPAIRLTQPRLEKVLGLQVPVERVNDILTSLGFSISKQEDSSILVTVPYWRVDIAQEDDLIEEVARIIGYNSLPTTTLSTPIPAFQPQPDRELREQVKDIMVACGMQEVISYSLTSLANLEKTQAIGDGIQPIKLANPMSEEQEYLRTNLRSSILSTLAYNQNNVREGIKLFEVGRTYMASQNGTASERHSSLPIEREMLVGVVTGPRWSENWFGDEGNLDFFDAKGILESFLSQLHIQYIFEPTDGPMFLPGRCATITASGSTLGVIGEVHTQVLERFQIDAAPVALFEIDLAALLQAQPSGTSQYQSLARYPGAYRDLALILNIDVTSASVQIIIEKSPLVARATLFDVYEGSGISVGMRSLAYRVLFQLPDRTLVGEEVNQALKEIMAALEKETGATLRNK
jgi:phenylalanyl-tRNA synthetase beta chain